VPYVCHAACDHIVVAAAGHAHVSTGRVAQQISLGSLGPNLLKQLAHCACGITAADVPLLCCNHMPLLPTASKKETHLEHESGGERLTIQRVCHTARY
jgi:hypothetical protein